QIDIFWTYFLNLYGNDRFRTACPWGFPDPNIRNPPPEDAIWNRSGFWVLDRSCTIPKTNPLYILWKNGRFSISLPDIFLHPFGEWWELILKPATQSFMQSKWNERSTLVYFASYVKRPLDILSPSL
ncbi:MAG: hypothetical protein OXH65_09130, partial [Paracoccaceae bacterium]|nr:hypothetical protein [Paracoccaceae bacterium]